VDAELSIDRPMIDRSIDRIHFGMAEKQTQQSSAIQLDTGFFEKRIIKRQADRCGK
jgi:hypothetical protein